MPALLLRLRNVPEDEYQEVCELLEQNQLDYYETQVGFWGIGTAAIWLHDSDQLDQAKTVLAEYMAQRQVRAQEAYQQAISAGEARTWWGTFKTQPIMFLVYVFVVVFILGISTLPFLGLL